MEKLTRAGIGPEGQLGKLDALSHAVRYYKTHLVKDATSPEQAKADLILTAVHGWKASLRKGKRKVRAKRIEEASNDSLSLDEVNQLVECSQMWEEFDNISRQCRRGGDGISDYELDLCSIVVATNILYKSWQRPGAICNVTLDEFKAAKMVVKDGKVVFIISVAEHKTGREGHAKLLLNTDDYNRLQQYVKSVRPLQDPNLSSKYMIVLSGHRQLDRMSARIKRLGSRYSLSLPTATRVRKIGSTTVALNVGGADASVITRQLSHTAKTDELHYQAIVGDEHSAQAFHSMESLRMGASPKSPGKRVPYTSQELQFIAKYFKSNINSGKTPSLKKCRKFLLNHPMSREAKQVQDRVKNFIKAVAL